jgi:hypothetical protein
MHHHGLWKWLQKGWSSWSLWSGSCTGNQLARIALGCSTMSSYHSGVGFVRFGWEMKH